MGEGAEPIVGPGRPAPGPVEGPGAPAVPPGDGSDGDAPAGALSGALSEALAEALSAALAETLPGAEGGPTGDVDDAERARVAAALARRFAVVGRLTEARCVADEAMRLAEASGDPHVRGVVLHAWGVVRHRHDDYPGALRHLTAALTVADQVGDDRLAALVSATTGSVLIHLADPMGAIDRLTRALDIAERLGGDGEVECEAYLALSRLYARLDEPARATGFAKRGLEIAQHRKDRPAELMALRHLGNVHASELERRGSLGLPGTEDGREAITWYEQAMPLARELGDRVTEVTLVNNTAHVLRFIGGEREAVERIEEVLAGGTEDITPVLVGLLYYNLGDSWLRLGEPDVALHWLREALRLVVENQSYEHVPKMHLALADAFEQIGDTQRALEQHKAYHEVERRMRGEQVRTQAVLAAMTLEHAEVAQESIRARQIHRDLVEQVASLSNQEVLLRDQARRDVLTGLPNRLAFDEWMADIADRSERAPVSVALLDLDRFKAINDGFSHLVGDEVLRRVGRLMEAVVRQGDLVARYGGEEFGMVLPSTSLEEAAAVCDRVRRAIAGTDWSAVRAGLGVTVSGGVAQESSARRALSVADRRLYEAKNAGRNRIVAH